MHGTTCDRWVGAGLQWPGGWGMLDVLTQGE